MRIPRPTLSPVTSNLGRDHTKLRIQSTKKSYWKLSGTAGVLETNLTRVCECCRPLIHTCQRTGLRYSQQAQALSNCVKVKFEECHGTQSLLKYRCRSQSARRRSDLVSCTVARGEVDGTCLRTDNCGACESAPPCGHASSAAADAT